MSLTPTQHREIRESLAAFGLTTPEQDAYLSLLSSGRTTATPIAKELRIPLTTAQSLLKRLAAKGVLHVSKHRSRSVYEAKDPAVFKALMESQLHELAAAIPLLRELQAGQITPAKIRVFDRERMTDLFRQALLSKEKLVYEIVSAKDLQETLGEKFHFSRRRVEKGIRLKSLRVEAYEIKKYTSAAHARELREAKFLPRELTFRSSVLFWDDTAAFFPEPREGLAWLVKSASIVEMLKQVFDLLWSVSRKMETG